ncbi:MAG: class II aldolase/adducin family protein, partial [candidate division NC10 bacterium]
MISRWSDAEAKGLDGLDLLVYGSRLIGAEPSLVVWGGGNTSLKVEERDFRGRTARVLRVKGSGSDLKSVARKDFPGVRMDEILALLERSDMGDQEMVDYLAHSLQEMGGSRPSIETLLHGFLPHEAVIHTHADAIVSLSNTDRCREVIQEVYGKDVVSIPYRRPGFLLSKDVANALRAHPGATAVILEKHGTITWGQTVKEAYLRTIDLITQAEEAIEARAKGRARFGGARLNPLPAGERREGALVVAPFLRGLVSRDKRAVLHFDDAPDVLEFVGSKEAGALSQVGPATPDHTIYTKRVACFVECDHPRDADRVKTALREAVKRFVADYTRYFEAHRQEGMTLFDPFPRVILVPGLGMFTSGKDKRTALIADDIYHHTISVLGAASAIGSFVSLTPKDAFDVEYWPLELYKLTLVPPEKELARRMPLVTAGASRIGKEVARRLAHE